MGLERPRHGSTQHHLLDASHVIYIHRLPEDLRKLAVFLMLDRLHADIMVLPDAPLDPDGNRQMRLIIVIDEAHHYLPCKQPTLEKMVREVRSKGVAIWLLPQSPDDFDQPRYNFARGNTPSATRAARIHRSGRPCLMSAKRRKCGIPSGKRR